MIKRLLASALMAAGALFLSAGVALAVPLYATSDTVVYQSQDRNSTRLGVMPAGTIAEGYCVNGGWCFVNQYNGWVSAASIDNPPGTPQSPSQVPQGPQGPQSPSQGGGGNNFPGFSFDFNLGNNPRPGPGPGRFDDDEVCFYTSSSFRGRSFCAEPGEASNRLSSNWNDAISSIEVFGDAEVEVCTDRNMRGTCGVIRRDTRTLPSRLNDRISSFEVY
jgi:hypothetical protein